VTADDLLALLSRHAAEIRDSLDADRLAQLNDRLHELQNAADDTARVRRAVLDIRKLLLSYLPSGSALRDPLGRELRAATAPASLPDIDLLSTTRTLLESVTWPYLPPESASLARAARRRLLAAPARGPERLTAEAARDPVRAGLIRLTGRDSTSSFPDFQFDPVTGEPRPVVQEINRLLLADEDPWGVADWWLAGNVWLQGTPADLIGDVPDEMLLDAARALVEDGAW
jgi:hypothetical protein